MSVFQREQWEIEHFAHANLGDIRCTKRLIMAAEQVAALSDFPQLITEINILIETIFA